MSLIVLVEAISGAGPRSERASSLAVSIPDPPKRENGVDNMKEGDEARLKPPTRLMASSVKWTVEAIAQFQSILFDRELNGEADIEPSFFADLNLDQVRDGLLSGREEYRLAPYFHVPLRDPHSIQYRHAVMRDLWAPRPRRAVDAFARRMREMRDALAAGEKARYELQRQRLRLEAIDQYCAAVHSLGEDLRDSGARSSGFDGLQEYLRRYLGSQEFALLESETRQLLDALGEIRYLLHLKGNRVRVGRYEHEPDFGAEINATFEKFGDPSEKRQEWNIRDWPELNHVEAQILDRLAKLHPELFASAADYYERRRSFLDRVLVRFDREVQLYLAYLDYIEPLAAAGLRFSFPEVASDSKDELVEEAFDLALASKLVAGGAAVITNGYSLTGAERILVVTGPNQGGKTTFARMFGQLHHLAALGLPVPAAHARLFVPDRVFTHFEREEDIETLSGKLEEELLRIREILERATGQSVIVMNESLASTTLADARFLGTELIGRLIDLDAPSAYVTFVDELASLGEATVSMVATVLPDDPTVRTFQVIRRPADGLAYAAAIAHKYGLEYESLRSRIAA
jgi:DNA mismatch repair protein MutS